MAVLWKGVDHYNITRKPWKHILKEKAIFISVSSFHQKKLHVGEPLEQQMKIRLCELKQYPQISL